MYYIYILHCADGLLYTGYAPDLKVRIEKHNSGFVFSTKHRRPVTLIHYEAFLYEKDAKRRETYLKGGNGKKEIEIMLTSYFEKKPWKKREVKPSTSKTCPICGGAGKAPNDMFFKNGK